MDGHVPRPSTKVGVALHRSTMRAMPGRVLPLHHPRVVAPYSGPTSAEPVQLLRSEGLLIAPECVQWLEDEGFPAPVAVGGLQFGSSFGNRWHFHGLQHSADDVSEGYGVVEDVADHRVWQERDGLGCSLHCPPGVPSVCKPDCLDSICRVPASSALVLLNCLRRPLHLERDASLLPGDENICNPITIWVTGLDLDLPPSRTRDISDDLFGTNMVDCLRLRGTSKAGLVCEVSADRLCPSRDRRCAVWKLQTRRVTSVANTDSFKLSFGEIEGNDGLTVEQRNLHGDRLASGPDISGSSDLSVG